MPLQIQFDHTIDAPLETVWEVITDLASYPEWNPFMVRCESSLKAGDPIKMKVHVLKAFAMPQKETITVNQPLQKLGYGISLPAKMLFSQRDHLLEKNNQGGTDYQSVFILDGWLSPIVKLLLEKQLQRGFREMSAAIKARAESKI